MPPYVYVENKKIAKIDRVIEDKGEYSWFRKGPTAEDFFHEKVTPHFFSKAFSYIKEKVVDEEPFLIPSFTLSSYTDSSNREMVRKKWSK